MRDSGQQTADSGQPEGPVPIPATLPQGMLHSLMELSKEMRAVAASVSHLQLRPCGLSNTHA